MISTVKLNNYAKSEVGEIEKFHPDEPDMLLSRAALGDMSANTADGRFNRQMVFEKYGIDSRNVYALKQIHSQRVFFSGGEFSHGTEGDGLIAHTPEHVLSVTVADCMPIYLFHRQSKRFAVVHSGWKGTGIAAEALRLMSETYALPVSAFSAVLGPSIRSCCYEVDEGRAELFRSKWGERSVVWRDGQGGQARPYLDLLQANISLLNEAGVDDLRVVDECTYCNTDHGSFRREGPEVFTHMLAMIGYFK